MSYINLHTHSEFSALDGMGSIEDYVSRAVELNQKYLGITDHGTIVGALKFQKECEKQGISPVIGSELYIVPNIQTKDKYKHIIILCTNLTGWTELCRLITFSNLHGFYRKPRIDFPTLLNSDTSGWIITTACLSGFVNLKGGIDLLNELKIKMPGRLYLEIQPHQEQIQKDYNERLLKIHKETKLPLVISNDCHYVNRSDWKAQECLLAIQSKATWDDPNRWKFAMKGLHLRSENEIIKALERQGQLSDVQIEEAIANTLKIAEQCSPFRIPRQEINLPCAPGTEGKDENKILDDLCRKAIKERGLSKQYIERYEEEFELISKKKFSQYFLIIWDVLKYCDREGIEYGPGRGSAGGSLLANLLGIHKLDPIEHNLSFARFMQEDRIDWPDIDVDFQHNRRDEVVRYIKDTYGENHVCGISTDSRMKGKSVVWDIGRVFKIPNKDVSEAAKNIDPKPHEKVLPDYFENDETGRLFFENWSEPARLMLKLENQLRHFGKHPAAVCISADDLTSGKYGSLRVQNGEVVSSWDMADSEYNGLMKFDILALSTLSVLSECRRLIQQKNQEFQFEKLSLDDPKVFKMLSEGDTSGVFQFEEWPSTNLCKEMGVDSYEDMRAIAALVRPGPTDSGMTEEFVKRKKGKKWEPIHPIYEEITKDTYGLLVYQDQVLQVINKVTGLSQSEADRIRKVIGKKRDAKEFEPYKIKIFEGCKRKKTLTQKQAEDFWDGLMKWAGYGFGKAHSTSYSIIGYRTAFCKVNYPREFTCANLTYSKKERHQNLIDGIDKLGLKLMLPKVDISDPFKWIRKDDCLYVPFSEINTIGETQAEKYCKTEVRNEGFFAIKLVPDTKTKIGQLLKEIGAYDPDKEPNPEIVKKHFPFVLPNQTNSDSLINNLLGYSDLDLSNPVNGVWRNKDGEKLIKTVRRFQNKDILNCNDCELRKQAKKPVLPSPGVFNVMIVGEAPGQQENRDGYGFNEKAIAGKMLWEELKLYGLKRQMFYVTNCAKCFPGKEIKTPQNEHLQACKKWFVEEVKRVKPVLALGVGGISNKMFTGRNGGIMKLSGTTEWVEFEGNGFWVCWCIHPAAVARSPRNKGYFVDGVKNFAEKFGGLMR